MRKSSSLWRFSKKAVDTEVLELKLELQNLKAENRVLKLQLDRRADRDIKSSGSAKDRKRSSPTKRKHLREGIEREKSIGRIDKEGRSRQLSISSSTSENDLAGIDFQSRSRSASTQSETGEDIFLRDSYRADYSRDSLSPSREGSRTDLLALRESRDNRADLLQAMKDSNISGDVVRSKSEGDDTVETMQKEILVLHDKILEQQQMLRREEGTRLDIEKDYRRVKEYDETALVDMESITRLLQQNLSDLKLQLEIEFSDGIEFSDED